MLMFCNWFQEYLIVSIGLLRTLCVPYWQCIFPLLILQQRCNEITFSTDQGSTYFYFLYKLKFIFYSSHFLVALHFVEFYSVVNFSDVFACGGKSTNRSAFFKSKKVPLHNRISVVTLVEW